MPTYSDDFNGSGALGGSLTEVGSRPWTAHNGYWARVGGRAEASSWSEPGAVATIDASSADVDVTVAMSQGGGGDALVFRFQDASNYLRIWNYSSKDAFGNNIFQAIFQKIVNGQGGDNVSGGVLSDGSAGLAAITTLRVRAEGSTIQLYINGTLRATYTDATFASATRHGVGHRTTGTNWNQIESFSAATINLPPNAPTPTSPSDGATIDRASAVQLAATFSDPNPADSPSASQWRYRVVGAATWTTVTQNNTLQTYSIPAGLAAGNYEWQAAYADQDGEWGPFSASSFFTAADPPAGPSWLTPTSGQTITTSSFTGAISQPSLTASEWKLYADNAGTIDTATVLAGPVLKTTGDLRSHTFEGLETGVPVWWSVSIEDGGLWSQEVRVRTPVLFTPPAAPTLTVAKSDANGLASATWANPAPSGSEPEVSHVDLYVRDTSGSDQYRPAAGVRVAYAKAPNSTHIDHVAASGVNYEYQAVAVGTNGATAASAWTPIDPNAEPIIYYGGGYGQ